MTRKTSQRLQIEMTEEYLRDMLGLPREAVIREFAYEPNRNLYRAHLISDTEIAGAGRSYEGMESYRMTLYEYNKTRTEQERLEFLRDRIFAMIRSEGATLVESDSGGGSDIILGDYYIFLNDDGPAQAADKAITSK